MSNQANPGPWVSWSPRAGERSWHVIRRNPLGVMGIEFLWAKKEAKRFRSKEAADRAADKENAAIAKTTESVS